MAAVVRSACVCVRADGKMGELRPKNAIVQVSCSRVFDNNILRSQLFHVVGYS